MLADLFNILHEIIGLLREIRNGIDATKAEGLDPAAAAEYCGVSVATWHDWDRKNMCPAAARVSERLPRWSRTELKAWILTGKPSRARWQMMRDSALRRAG
jgi:hypothetical protein